MLNQRIIHRVKHNFLHLFLHQFLFGKEDYDPSDEVKEANDAIIELTGVDPETYKETTDFTYKSGGEESDTSEKQNSK